MTDHQLEIQDLTVSYRLQNRSENVVVANVSLELRGGEVVGLVGESGCGKSTLALAGIGYRAGNARLAGGKAMFDGDDLLQLGTKRLRRVWGRRIAYIGQSASTSLNPALKVGRQVSDVLSHHLDIHGAESVERQEQLLDEVGIPEPQLALSRYPAQFSGGQQQRIAIAIALAARPEVIILDEPTTGLDVTTQARINEILRRLLAETGAATLYVSHDVSLLSTISDRLLVMYGGEVVEEGTTRAVVAAPAHPYTRALLASVPRVDLPIRLEGIPGRPPDAVVLDRCAFAPRCAYATEKCSAAHPELVISREERRVRCVRQEELSHLDVLQRRVNDATAPERPLAGAGEELLEVAGLDYSYPSGVGLALASVAFTLRERETIGIVGESGSGKTTLLRALAGILTPTRGEMRYKGQLLPSLAKRTRAQLGEIQLVFQNPESSLNPRQSIRELIGRPLELFRLDLRKEQRSNTILELLESVLLPMSVLHRLPGELSGGQMQRVALARAFAAQPTLLLCDEVTSALDVSVQATILNLIRDLASEVGTAVVFVSHDLAVVRSVAARVVVMQGGHVREQGLADDLFSNPTSEYTQELLRAIPNLGEFRQELAVPRADVR